MKLFQTRFGVPGFRLRFEQVSLSHVLHAAGDPAVSRLGQQPLAFSDLGGLPDEPAVTAAPRDGEPTPKQAIVAAGLQAAGECGQGAGSGIQHRRHATVQTPGDLF
jgi:hypothetical protein